MQKIISLFQRNYGGDHLVRDEVVPGAEWVLAGEGVATVKWDGTCCLLRDGRLYKRYELAPGKTPPPDFEPAQAPDLVTGKQSGWVPVGDGPEDRWHREAMETFGRALLDGTYELVGPKVQGNPHGLSFHELVRHGAAPVPSAPRTFDALRDFLATFHAEGLVWHHPDGRMVKIKRRDFGFR